MKSNKKLALDKAIALGYLGNLNFCVEAGLLRRSMEVIGILSRLPAAVGPEFIAAIDRAQNWIDSETICENQYMPSIATKSLHIPISRQLADWYFGPLTAVFRVRSKLLLSSNHFSPSKDACFGALLTLLC